MGRNLYIEALLFFSLIIIHFMSSVVYPRQNPVLSRADILFDHHAPCRLARVEC
jgi:hypothetical protein